MTDKRLQFVDLVDAMLERQPIPEVKPEPIIEDDIEDPPEHIDLSNKPQPKRLAGEVDSVQPSRGRSNTEKPRRRNQRGRRGGDGQRAHKSGDQPKKAKSGDDRRRSQGEKTRGGQNPENKNERADGERPNRRRRRRRGGGKGQNSSRSGPPKNSDGSP